MSCEYFARCPLRRFEEKGQISLNWRKKYCEDKFQDCIRYQEALKKIPHPDNKMPDGSLAEIK